MVVVDDVPEEVSEFEVVADDMDSFYAVTG